MRLSSKALAWGLIAAGTMTASSFSPPVAAATSASGDQAQAWSCGHPNLPAWLRVCVNAQGQRLYQVDTGNHGPHGTFAASGAVSLQQVDPETVSVSFSPTSVTFFRGLTVLSEMPRQVYEDKEVAIREVQDGQHASIFVIHPRDDRASRFLMEMCSGSDCGSGLQKE